VQTPLTGDGLTEPGLPFPVFGEAVDAFAMSDVELLT